MLMGKKENRKRKLENGKWKNGGAFRTFLAIFPFPFSNFHFYLCLRSSAFICG
jgi:hypothetical protein